MNDTDKLIQSAGALLERIGKLLPAGPAPTDWKASIAFRWRKREGRGAIEPVRHVHKINLSDLQGIDTQKKIVAQWLGHFKVAGANTDTVRQAALQWALQRGSRSGRVAWQFARDWAGRSRVARGK